jgi:DNA polymerase II large subunit
MPQYTKCPICDTQIVETIEVGSVNTWMDHLAFAALQITIKENSPLRQLRREIARRERLFHGVDPETIACLDTCSATYKTARLMSTIASLSDVNDVVDAVQGVRQLKSMWAL